MPYIIEYRRIDQVHWARSFNRTENGICLGLYEFTGKRKAKKEARRQQSRSERLEYRVTELVVRDSPSGAIGAHAPPRTSGAQIKPQL